MEDHRGDPQLKKDSLNTVKAVMKSYPYISKTVKQLENEKFSSEEIRNVNSKKHSKSNYPANFEKDSKCSERLAEVISQEDDVYNRVDEIPYLRLRAQSRNEELRLDRHIKRASSC
jgi:hypothetical protein